MTYALWDKQTPIYDVTPEQAFANNPKYQTEDSYLFLKDDGSIYDILPLSEIPNPDGLTSPDEICAAYIVKLTTQPEPKQQVSLSELKEKVTVLEDELAAAKILLGVE